MTVCCWDGQFSSQLLSPLQRLKAPSTQTHFVLKHITFAKTPIGPLLNFADLVLVLGIAFKIEVQKKETMKQNPVIDSYTKWFLSCILSIGTLLVYFKLNCLYEQAKKSPDFSVINVAPLFCLEPNYSFLPVWLL